MRIWIPEAPHIITNPYRELQVDLPPLRVEGRFSAALYHARTRTVVERYSFRNLIVDSGLNRLGTEFASNIIQYCAVGTGNTPPTASDTALQAEVGRTNSAGGFSVSSGLAADQSYAYLTLNRVFTEAQANGNLTEIGMFRSTLGNANDLMWARQLIRDNNGEPTTIPKTPEFQLRTGYTFRVYLPITVEEETATVSGVSRTFRKRALSLSNAGGWPNMAISLGSWTATSSTVFSGVTDFSASVNGTWSSTPAASSGDSTRSVASYLSGSYYRDTLHEWTGNAANFTHAAFDCGLCGHGSAKYGIIVSPATSKTSTQKLMLTLRHSWARQP